jgi:ribosomal protein S18
MPNDHKVFSLKIVNKDSLEKDIESYQQDKTQKFSAVILDGDNESYSFLDESKKEHRAKLTMVNLNDDCHCFWCRHSFDNMPIGCPIQYKNARILKSYFSEVTKDKYDIISSIPGTLPDTLQENMSLIDNGYFLVDGVFCSFNCCLAFIQENNKNMLYDMSKQLLYKMYTMCFPQTPSTHSIIPAPHWRLLKSYGGHLTIEEFRKKFNKIKYVEDNFANKSVSWIYREDVIF